MVSSIAGAEETHVWLFAVNTNMSPASEASAASESSNTDTVPEEEPTAENPREEVRDIIHNLNSLNLNRFWSVFFIIW